jgi:hypothetical protein
MSRAAFRVLLPAAAFAAASGAQAQFVQLTRCQAAYPCNVPFGLQYKPDPLIAAQYANVPTTAFSGRIDLQWPLLPPAIDLSKELQHQDFAREAARIFVMRHPAPKPTPAPAESATSGEPAKN